MWCVCMIYVWYGVCAVWYGVWMCMYEWVCVLYLGGLLHGSSLQRVTGVHVCGCPHMYGWNTALHHPAVLSLGADHTSSIHLGSLGMESVCLCRAVRGRVGEGMNGHGWHVCASDSGASPWVPCCAWWLAATMVLATVPAWISLLFCPPAPQSPLLECGRATS